MLNDLVVLDEARGAVHRFDARLIPTAQQLFWRREVDVIYRSLEPLPKMLNLPLLSNDIDKPTACHRLKRNCANDHVVNEPSIVSLGI